MLEARDEGDSTAAVAAVLIDRGAEWEELDFAVSSTTCWRYLGNARGCGSQDLRVGALRGRVVDEKGEGVGGVEMEVLGAGGEVVAKMWTSWAGEFAAGEFAAGELEKGRYGVVASLPGFLVFRGEVEVDPGLGRGELEVKLGFVECSGARVSDRPPGRP